MTPCQKILDESKPGQGYRCKWIIKFWFEYLVDEDREHDLAELTTPPPVAHSQRRMWGEPTTVYGRKKTPHREPLTLGERRWNQKVGDGE